jgi:hypothetical protein
MGEQTKWGQVRVKSDFLIQIEKYVSTHPEYPSVSSFVSSVLSKEINQ